MKISRKKSAAATIEPFVPPLFAAVEQPVTTRQLAKHLQVTVRTVAEWRARRRIPFWKINSRNIRYRISDVERVLSRDS